MLAPVADRNTDRAAGLLGSGFGRELALQSGTVDWAFRRQVERPRSGDRVEDSGAARETPRRRDGRAIGAVLGGAGILHEKGSLPDLSDGDPHAHAARLRHRR